MARKVEMNHMEKKQSVLLSAKITETESRLLALPGELEAIDRQYVTVAGAEELDTAAVNSLQTRRQAVLTEQETFTRRIEVLREKLAEAEKTEGVQRLAEIQGQQVLLAAEADRCVKDFRATFDDLLATVERLRGVLKMRSELSAEGGFLAVACDVSRPGLPYLVAVIGRDCLAALEHAVGTLSTAVLTRMRPRSHNAETSPECLQGGLLARLW